VCGWRARSVYSFGVVCWELLTRRCPYEGLNHIQVCVRVRHGWVGWVMASLDACGGGTRPGCHGDNKGPKNARAAVVDARGYVRACE
jgi:hypothetical protein